MLHKARKEELHWQTFLLAFGIAFAFFVPFIINDNGYFLFFGDFNVQQVPFYKMAHEMVRSGNLFWNWETDLGVNFIGSYSFYLLGSPFFWLTLPFPTDFVPYLMGPLLILKFALSAFTAYFYIRRFVRRPQSAMLGGLLYAFSGFSVYNIFFNHFHEAIVFFPLLLLALEVFITENKRGWLALAVFICAISNYFFFFGMAVFSIIYWFIRTVSGCWKISFKRFFALVFEVILGGLLSCFILLPSFLAVIQNSRVSEFLYGWNAFLYGKEQIYLNIIECFFFPPDLPARPIFFSGADVKWSSLGGWLPLVSMTGVVAWLQYKKGHWLKRIICTLIFMAMVPILNSAFYMFNSAYYARWFYMPVLMMSLATVMALEDHKVEVTRSFKWVAAITVAITLIVGLFPEGADSEGNITRFGLFTADGEGSNTFMIRFWVTSAIAIASLIVFRIILVFIKRNVKLFYRMSIICVCAFSLLYSFFFIASGKQHSYDVDDVMIDRLLEADVELPGNSDRYRIDVYDGVDNTGMYLGYDSINAFHSIVPGSVNEFYEFVGEERGVASRPETKTYGIRSLLSVKYLLNRNGADSFINNYGDTRMPGWTLLYDDMDGYAVYENQNYIPYGFTYEYYMTEEQSGYYGESYRHLMLLKAMLLTEDQAKKYEGLLKNIAEDYIIGSEGIIDNGIIGERQSIEFNDATYAEDCQKLAATAATYFSRDNNGFTATITTDRENLVFFSVPYEEGWSATVNGKTVEIENVNAGFMAVKVPAGSSTIRFNYMTPGLIEGIVLSIAGLLILGIYLLVFLIIKKVKKPRAMALNEVWPERAELEANWRESDVIDNDFLYTIEHDVELEEELEMSRELELQREHRFDKSDDDDGFNIDLDATAESSPGFDASAFKLTQLEDDGTKED